MADLSSIYFYDNAVTSDMVVVAQWDSYFGETACNSFALSTAITATATPWLTTALPANLARYRTATYTAYGVFDVNNRGTDSTAANPLVAMTNMDLFDLGTTCTTAGTRIIVPIQVAAQTVKLPSGSLSFPHNPICYYDNGLSAGS